MRKGSPITRLKGNGVKISDCPAAVSSFMSYGDIATAPLFYVLGGKVPQGRSEVRRPALSLYASGIFSVQGVEAILCFRNMP